MNSVFVALALTAASSSPAPQLQSELPLSKPMQVAMLCFKTGEQQSGMNKICYYDCAGSSAAITISAVKLCPLSINN